MRQQNSNQWDNNKSREWNSTKQINKTATKLMNQTSKIQWMRTQIPNEQKGLKSPWRPGAHGPWAQGPPKTMKATELIPNEWDSNKFNKGDSNKHPINKTATNPMTGNEKLRWADGIKNWFGPGLLGPGPKQTMRQQKHPMNETAKASNEWERKSPMRRWSFHWEEPEGRT